MSLKIFPVYRKYCNAQTYFKVESNTKLVERQILGGKYFETVINAAQYPEKLKISEIISLQNAAYCESTAQEFNNIDRDYRRVAF